MSTFDLFSSYNEENQDEIPVRRDSARKSARSTDKKRKRGRSKNTSKDEDDSNDEELLTTDVEELTNQAEPKQEKKKQTTSSRPSDVIELFDESVNEASQVEKDELIPEQLTATIATADEVKKVAESELPKAEIESPKPEVIKEKLEEQAEIKAEKVQELVESTYQEEAATVAPEIESKEQVVSIEIIDENVVSESEEIENLTESVSDLEIKIEEVEEDEKPEIDELSDTVSQLINLVQPEEEKTKELKAESKEDSIIEETAEAIQDKLEIELVPEIEEKPKANSVVKPFISLKRTPPKEQEEIISETTEAKQELAKPFMSLKRSVSKPLDEDKVTEEVAAVKKEAPEIEEIVETVEAVEDIKAEVFSIKEESIELNSAPEIEQDLIDSSENDLLDDIIDEISDEEDLSIESSKQLLEEIKDLKETELVENEDSIEFSDEIGLNELSKTIEKPISFGFTETVEEEIEKEDSFAVLEESENQLEIEEEKPESLIVDEALLETESESISTSESEIKIEIEEDAKLNENNLVVNEPETISDSVQEEKNPLVEEVQIEEKPKKRSFFNLNKIVSKSEPELEVESTPVIEIPIEKVEEKLVIEPEVIEAFEDQIDEAPEFSSHIIEETVEELQDEVAPVSSTEIAKGDTVLEQEGVTQLEAETSPIQIEIDTEQSENVELEKNEIQEENAVTDTIDDQDSEELKSVVLPALGSLKSRLHPARSRRAGFQMPELPKRISEKLEAVEEQSIELGNEILQKEIEKNIEQSTPQNEVIPEPLESTSLQIDPVIKAPVAKKIHLDEVDDSLIDELIIEETSDDSSVATDVEMEQNDVKENEVPTEDSDFLNDLIHDVIEDDPLLAKVQQKTEEKKLEDKSVINQINEVKEERVEEAENEASILEDTLFETLLGNDFSADSLINAEAEEVKSEDKVEEEEENDFQLGEVDFSDIFEQLIENALDDDEESPPTLHVDDLLQNEEKQKEDSALKKNQSLQGAINLIDESISAIDDLEGDFEEGVAPKEDNEPAELKQEIVTSSLDLKDSNAEHLVVQEEELIDDILDSVLDSEDKDPLHEALFGNHSVNKLKEEKSESENEANQDVEKLAEKKVGDDIFGVNETYYHSKNDDSNGRELDTNSEENINGEELEPDFEEENFEEGKEEPIVAENEELEQVNDNEDPVIAAKVSEDNVESDDIDDVLDEILHLSQNEEDVTDATDKDDLQSSEDLDQEEISQELKDFNEKVESDDTDEEKSEEEDSKPEIQIEEPDWYLEILAGMNKPTTEVAEEPASDLESEDSNSETQDAVLDETENEEVSVTEDDKAEVNENENEKTASSWTPENKNKIPVNISNDSVKKQNEFKKREARGKFKKQQEDDSAVNANGDQMPLPDFDPLAIYKGMVRRWFIINRHTIGLFIGGLIAFRNALPKSRTKGLKFGLTRMAAFVLKIFVAKELRDKSFAVQLRRRLELMGPTYIKLGQILALREDILPPVVTEELKNLLDRLPQIPFADIRGIVEAELGMKLEECFKDVNRSPIGTASIAQTHFATTIDDEKVVLKVVKPGIRDSILTDIRLLKLISGFLQWAIPQYQPKMLIDEFCVYTEKEVDLTNEADHAEIFAANFTEMEGVRFPKIYREYSGQDVLCMEFMAGYKPGHEKMYELSIEEREYLVDRGAASIIQMLYKDGFFHADLHPGNLMIMDGALGFIDLGMVGRFEDKTRRRMLYYFHALVTGDIDGATKYLLAMAKIGEGGDPQGFRRAVADVLRRYYMHSQSGDFSLGKLILNSLSIGGKYRVFFPVEMTLMVKALVTFEGVGYMLVPKLDIPALSEKYVSKIFKDQFNPKAITQELMRGAPELVDMLVQLPKISADGLKFLEEFMNDRSPSNPLEGVKGAIIAGALLVGGVISLVQGSHFGVYTILFALSALFAMFGK